MFGLGWMELLILLGIVVIVFGASRLPEIGRGAGSMIQEFRKSLKGDSEEDKKDEEPKKIKEE